MTVHAAKGLEFPYVFLCSMNEDVFPSKKISTLSQMEEERRLAFVAYTRAEKGLFLSEAEGRTFDGAPRYPSRFILDIDRDLLDYDEPPAEDLIKDARNYISSKSRLMPENIEQNILPAGTRVRHDVFGEGTVIEADTSRGVHIIKFDMLHTNRALTFKARINVIK